jgi:hypothetical protein
LVGPYDVCGEYEFTNIASFVTNDTGAMGSDFWTVIVDIPCLTGCTLTQGYWKTHSEFGPAPYDETWGKLDANEDGDYEGASEPFFDTGYTYYEIFQMAPKGGNAYIILAHQWIAAQLNTLNGAYIPSDVLDAWNEAAGLLTTYASELDIPKDTAPDDRARAIELAGILDMYNNGDIGPGYCTDVEP